LKITFEGKDIAELFKEMESLLAEFNPTRQAPVTAPVEKPVAKPVEDLGDTPVFTSSVNPFPVEKPKRERTQKQLENDERRRAAAQAKKASGKPFFKKAEPDLDKYPTPPPPKTAAGMSPDEIVKMRTTTIEDLQSAYANGHQAEVFELLSRFGNGAKSFRELPPEAFAPIREAIDLGALT